MMQMVEVTEMLMMLMEVIEVMMVLMLMKECRGPEDHYNASIHMMHWLFGNKQTDGQQLSRIKIRMHISLINLFVMQVSRIRIAELEPLLCNIDFAFTFGLLSKYIQLALTTNGIAMFW